MEHLPDRGHSHSRVRLLDVAELAGRLAVTERTIRRHVDERRIPFLKIDKFVRFDLAEVETLIEAGGLEELSGASPT